MSGGVVVDAYGAHKAEEVMRDTWGHMDANPGTAYTGSIVFAVGIYGDDARAIVSCDFGSAGCGPWFYEGVNEWISDQRCEPGVYRFEGIYRLRRGGEHEFKGDVRHVELSS